MLELFWDYRYSLQGPSNQLLICMTVTVVLLVGIQQHETIPHGFSMIFGNHSYRSQLLLNLTCYDFENNERLYQGYEFLLVSLGVCGRVRWVVEGGLPVANERQGEGGGEGGGWGGDRQRNGQVNERKNIFREVRLCSEI